MAFCDRLAQKITVDCFRRLDLLRNPKYNSSTVSYDIIQLTSPFLNLTRPLNFSFFDGVSNDPRALILVLFIPYRLLEFL